jgi:hypothetical protein
VPSCMYYAVLMLTGQGVPQGDFPVYTKLIVCRRSLVVLRRVACCAVLVLYVT